MQAVPQASISPTHTVSTCLSFTDTIYYIMKFKYISVNTPTLPTHMVIILDTRTQERTCHCGTKEEVNSILAYHDSYEVCEEVYELRLAKVKTLATIL